MQIGLKLRELRIAKNLSQGDIEMRTGLLRSYTSRVEHGMTTPTIQTLEKYANALKVPLYTFFHDGASPLKKLDLASRTRGPLFGTKSGELEELLQLARAIRRMNGRSRNLLMHMAQHMVLRHERSNR
jgi:transcriptional regulator with XRE-family HTH domain